MLARGFIFYLGRQYDFKVETVRLKNIKVVVSAVIQRTINLANQ